MSGWVVPAHLAWEAKESRDMDAIREYMSEVKARVEAATPGPWVAWQGDNNFYPIDEKATIDKYWNIDQDENVILDAGWVVRKAYEPTDAAFIAHSRQDVPRLLDPLDLTVSVLERLAGENELAQQALLDVQNTLKA